METAGQTGSSNALPTVYVAQRVIDKMCRGALYYVGGETGEALVGVALPQLGEKLPRLYVLDTIPPVEYVVREWVTFEQGDDWQGAIFNWWHENWELYREMRRASYGRAVAAKWDAPLLHLGDWHKQPGGMVEPSRGDFRTARRFMRELERDYLLTPIVTLAEEAIALPQPNTLIVETPFEADETQSAGIRIDFWWLARKGSTFEPVKAVVKPDAFFPRLPPVVWWLDQRRRFDEELALLEEDGLQVLDVVSWNTRGHPPLDTCLTIYRPGARSVVIAVTPVNYPAHSPHWRIAPIMRPKKGEDLFAMLYDASTKVPPDVVAEWTATHYLVDGVKAIETWENNR
jgi:hypothetical protein